MRCVQACEQINLRGTFAGSATALFPNIQKIPGDEATFTAEVPYLLVGLVLSSSLVIFGSNKGGIVVVIGQRQPQITVSKSIKSPVHHITGPNSITGTPNIIVPTSKVTPVSFGAYGVIIPALTPVSLYAFADATAGNDLFAIASLQLLQIQ